MVKSLSIVIMGVHAAKVRNAIKVAGQCSTTIPREGLSKAAIGVRRNS